ncbi:MAG: GNAT family N-acetyltransferase [Myxococcales bacterium]|nr:GNAT family N-acetyltransferase [Myxococcales bacterium]MCB9736135.1 GNAT family N-acetyltransferase [Deltaproteobacteria bacterium]
MQTFATARLRLRPIDEGDLDDLLALDGDPEVMRYLGATPTREDYVAQLIPRMTRWQREPFGYFAAATADDPFIGWFHLRPSVADPAIHELGYRLARRAWGRGLATEGSLALCRHAFSVLAMPAVDAVTLPDNARSRRVMEKCGMRLVGPFRHPAGLDCVRYVATRADFEAAAAGLL